MLIISIVGIDGSGKTTQAKLLVNKLKNKGYSVKYIRPTYLLYDKLKRNNSAILYSPRKIVRKNHKPNFLKKNIINLSALFYAYITWVIIRIISFNKIIVCDRYFYQFFYDLHGQNSIKILNILPKPDLTILLQDNLTNLWSRMDDFDQKMDKKYYEDLTIFFNKLADYNNFISINASLNKTEVSEKIYQEVKVILQ